MLRNRLLALSLVFFLAPVFAQEAFEYDAKDRRNPFIPLVTSDGRLLNLDKEESKQDLVLEGIIFDKSGRSYAIVNSEVVGIGDQVLDYKVLKIDEEKVIFVKDGALKEVAINKEAEE